MQLSKDCSYGLRVAISLARREGDANLAEISHEHNVAPSYLAKVIGELVREGIVVPTGPNRIRLADDPATVSVADVLAVYGETLPLERCLMHDDVIHPCEKMEDCGLCALWKQVQQEINETLTRHTLAEFARAAGTCELKDGPASPPDGTEE